MDSFEYSYSNSAGNIDNIKIEINYSLRSHILPTVLTAVSVSNAFSEFEVRTLSPVEIFVSKIVALSGRAATRDLYDLNNVSYFGLFDERQLTLLRKSVVFYQAVAGNVKMQGFDFAKALTEITERKTRTDLFPMIRNTERFDFPSAKQRVAEFLADNLTLAEPEKALFKEFSQGNYNPEMLFDDESVLERIKTHPMAAWRIQRI